MKKYLCERDCFIPAAGASYASLHSRGSVYNFEKLEKGHEYLFTCIDEGEKDLDFATASEEHLMESDWKAKELVAFVTENYSVDIKVNRGTTKKSLINKLIYARENYRDVPEGH